MRYQIVCVAGTFDGLHAGHEALLRKAFEVGEKVLIGITSDDFVRRYKSPRSLKSPRLPTSSYDIRKQAISTWLTTHGFADRATIVSINDPYEPAVSSKDIEALVVSEETKKRGEELNHKREANGLFPLKLIVVPMQRAGDGKNISSTRVRGGEVDRLGRLLMPDSLRSELAQPLGTVLAGDALRSVLSSLARPGLACVITVGDLTTKTFLDNGITPQLMIIDNKVERKAYPDLRPIFATRHFSKRFVASGPGFISKEAIMLIRSRFRESVVIEVDGEEDLLALLAIIEAPIGSVVYYGQPGRGIVEVVVTEDKKEVVRTLLTQFVVW